MANVKMSELPETQNRYNNDYAMIIQGNINKKISLGNLLEEKYTDSTNAEVKTNMTWYGSPIYRKVYRISLPNNTYTTESLNISNLNYITRLYGVVDGLGSDSQNPSEILPLPYVGSTTSENIKLSIENSSQIKIQTYKDRGDRAQWAKAYVTVEYTKTTD